MPVAPLRSPALRRAAGRRLLAASALLAAAALAGCEVTINAGDGGGDEPTPAPVAAGSRSFAERADAVCTDHARRVRAIGDRLGLPQSLEQQARYDRERAAASAAQLAALERLVPSAANRAAYAAWLDNHRAYVRTYEQGAAAAAAGDQAAHAELSRERLALGTEQVQAARALEMAACSRTLPADATAEVRDLVARVLTGEDPVTSCEQEVTQAFIDSNAGGSLLACEEVLTGLQRDGATVSFQGFSGVDEVLASAKVRFSTQRGKQPKALTYDLIYVEGRVPGWRIDSAFEPPATTQPSAPPSSSSGATS